MSRLDIKLPLPRPWVRPWTNMVWDRNKLSENAALSSAGWQAMLDEMHAWFDWPTPQYLFRVREGYEANRGRQRPHGSGV